jgi:ribosomal protein S18 acetylase RimI-like enzyme
MRDLLLRRFRAEDAGRARKMLGRSAEGSWRASPVIEVSMPGRLDVDTLGVRPAVVSDLPFVRRMLYEAANNPGEQWPRFDESMREPRNRRFWAALMTRRGDLGVIAEQSDTPIGAAWIRRMGKGERVPFDDPEVPVLVIGAELDHRGQGVGALLLSSLLEQARQTGIRAIDLTVGSFNEAARSLYQTYGFTDVGTYGEAIRMRALLE